MEAEGRGVQLVRLGIAQSCTTKVFMISSSSYSTCTHTLYLFGELNRTSSSYADAPVVPPDQHVKTASLDMDQCFVVAEKCGICESYRPQVVEKNLAIFESAYVSMGLIILRSYCLLMHSLCATYLWHEKHAIYPQVNEPLQGIPLQPGTVSKTSFVHVQNSQRIASFAVL